MLLATLIVVCVMLALDLIGLTGVFRRRAQQLVAEKIAQALVTDCDLDELIVAEFARVKRDAARRS